MDAINCHGCGSRLPTRQRRGGPPRKWCSEACRQRIGVRLGLDSGYAGVLVGDPCAYCGERSTSLDHIEPRSTGGADAWDNLAGACGRCNSQKRSQPLLHHLLARRLWAEIDDIRTELTALKAA